MVNKPGVNELEVSEEAAIFEFDEDEIFETDAGFVELSIFNCDDVLCLVVNLDCESLDGVLFGSSGTIVFLLSVPSFVHCIV